MKFRGCIAILLFSALSALANAASPLQDYLSARKAAIVAVMKDVDSKDSRTLRKMQLAQAKLKALAGPINVKGFPAQDGKADVGSGYGDEYDSLDCVYTRSFDGRTTLCVTTVPLFQAWWARESRSRWISGGSDAITSLRNKLGTHDFYDSTYVLKNGAGVAEYAELPVTVKGRSELARAILFLFAQDVPNVPPKAIAVSVLQGNQLYFLMEPVSVPEIAMCKNLEYDRVWSCYIRELPKQAQYPQWVKQAQDLVDRVPVVSSR